MLAAQLCPREFLCRGVTPRTSECACVWRWDEGKNEVTRVDPDAMAPRPCEKR